jgi:hypothetical protein
MVDVADKLADARKLIECGWTRGENLRNGRVCALGAIAQVLRGDAEAPVWGPDYRQVFSVLEEAIGDPDLVLHEWNDQQPSKKPVIEAFKRAEKIARRQS